MQERGVVELAVTLQLDYDSLPHSLACDHPTTTHTPGPHFIPHHPRTTVLLTQ